MEFVSKPALMVIAIQQSHVIEIGRLPEIHSDPFDRILVAQAIVEQLPLISKDRQMAKYGVKVLW